VAVATMDVNQLDAAKVCGSTPFWQGAYWPRHCHEQRCSRPVCVHSRLARDIGGMGQVGMVGAGMGQVGMGQGGCWYGAGAAHGQLGAWGHASFTVPNVRLLCLQECIGALMLKYPKSVRVGESRVAPLQLSTELCRKSGTPHNPTCTPVGMRP